METKVEQRDLPPYGTATSYWVLTAIGAWMVACTWAYAVQVIRRPDTLLNQPLWFVVLGCGGLYAAWRFQGWNQLWVAAGVVAAFAMVTG